MHAPADTSVKGVDAPPRFQALRLSTELASTAAPAPATCQPSACAPNSREASPPAAAIAP